MYGRPMTKIRAALAAIFVIQATLASFVIPGAAQADPNWDAIAACESGGNWGINTGNFEGGLQFLNSTWLSVKAPDDPPHAYQATRERQIAAAERLFSRSGIGQWPVCGHRG